MKKKIGELTLKELRAICKNRKCEDCPLVSNGDSPLWYDCKANFNDKDSEQYLDQEIEVEE